MRIWIDHANSPHPAFFAPLADRFQSSGHELIVTARDNAQTAELARATWPDAVIIGGPSPRSRSAKGRHVARRIVDLRRWAAAARPDVALSHNSYAQIMAARTISVPSVTAMDFEHQPANHLAFRLAAAVIVPEVFPEREIRRQGAARKVTRYPGLKEELYIGDFRPDPSVLEKLGISPRPPVLVVLRTPPSRALYHGTANPLFDQVLRVLAEQEEVVAVVLPRHPEQIRSIAGMALPNCVVPTRAVDARSLMYESDAVVGAGGTMTREAALMGIPTWTVFAGARPAADRWLERHGMLERLTNANQLRPLPPRRTAPKPLAELRGRAEAIERVIVETTLAAGQK